MFGSANETKGANLEGQVKSPRENNRPERGQADSL